MRDAAHDHAKGRRRLAFAGPGVDDDEALLAAFLAIMRSRAAFFLTILACGGRPPPRPVRAPCWALLRLDKAHTWANGGLNVGSCPTTGEEGMR